MKSFVIYWSLWERSFYSDSQLMTNSIWKNENEKVRSESILFPLSIISSLHPHQPSIYICFFVNVIDYLEYKNPPAFLNDSLPDNIAENDIYLFLESRTNSTKLITDVSHLTITSILWSRYKNKLIVFSFYV